MKQKLKFLFFTKKNYFLNIKLKWKTQIYKYHLNQNEYVLKMINLIIIIIVPHHIQKDSSNTHIITSIILFLSCLFHLVAICTNVWFYLNANSYNSNENVDNGGLWSFCSYSSPSSSFAQPYIYSNVKSKTSMSYEQYQIHTNTRLTSSRILIAFTFVLNVFVFVLFEIVASIGIGCLIRKQQDDVNMNNIVI